ncbi:protein PXR1-like isoform X1 [Penaeus chinensis]|uniref:protein PXR1-like isoform X1 n=1 Tax=Penaeus chinensis TaxID=139456 RepID=UPI001FB7516A|nr:protein PXR1-like isoform X1 [Penaeus chinensis]XP_047486893.1 protein PXR1-like isoform X1 [Penaeus chinensis]
MVQQRPEGVSPADWGTMMKAHARMKNTQVRVDKKKEKKEKEEKEEKEKKEKKEKAKKAKSTDNDSRHMAVSTVIPHQGPPSPSS